MTAITDPAVCPDCEEGLDENAYECATCGGEGELPGELATRIAAERAEQAALDLARALNGESPEGYDLFEHVADITAWLDACNPHSAHEDSMRVLKLVEESGEAAAAYIGMAGQNPRKGVTHSLDDLLSELADVALTALCAIQHFTRDEQTTRAILAAKTHRIITRSDIPRARP
jgi:hypothetical protein